MKKIKLTQGKYALVDDEDFEWLSQYVWYCVKDKRAHYARRNLYRADGLRTTLSMHREIMKHPKRRLVDHINGDGLDNRKANLRVGTLTQNNWHRVRLNKNNTSGYRGVGWSKSRGKWQAIVTHKGKNLFLGYFSNKEDAAVVYQSKVKELCGDWAAN